MYSNNVEPGIPFSAHGVDLGGGAHVEEHVVSGAGLQGHGQRVEVTGDDLRFVGADTAAVCLHCYFDLKHRHFIKPGSKTTNPTNTQLVSRKCKSHRCSLTSGLLYQFSDL